MKKLMLFIIAFVLVTPLAFGAWAFKIDNDSCRATDNGDFNCAVTFTDGINTVTEDVGYFRPKTEAEYLQGVANRTVTVESKVAAKALIDSVVLPDVVKQYDKPIAVSVSTVDGKQVITYTKGK